MDKPVFTFFVISDIQLTLKNELSHKKLADVLKALYDIDPDASALIINGDLVNDGREESYGKFKEIIEQHSLPNEVCYTIGNHEFFKNDGIELSINRFLAFSHLEKVYYEKEIHGYPFLFLGTESWGPIGSPTKDSAVLSHDQVKWLEEKIDHLKQATNPIFVFLHHPIPFTLYGTDLAYYKDAVIQDQELVKILANAENVFFFSGHSHWDLCFPKMYVEHPFPMANSGAVYDIWGPDGKGGDHVIDQAGSQGLYVQVFEKHVLIKGRDFTNKQWIPEFQYIIVLK